MTKRKNGKGKSKRPSLWDRQEDLISQGIDAAWGDPEIRNMYWLVRDLSQRVPLDDERFLIYLWRLEFLVKDRIPSLAHCLGPHLRAFLATSVTNGLTAREKLPESLRFDHVYRFLPDNPIVLSKDGNQLWGLRDATSEHRDQVQAYLDSIQEVTRRGRPRGSGDIDNISREDFIKRYKHLSKKHRKDDRPPVTQEDMAKELCTTVRVIRDYRKERNIPWPPC